MNDDERRLIERLEKILALYDSADTTGERAAAAAALGRIEAKMATSRAVAEEPEEFQFTITDYWNRRLFCALLAKHGLKPYRRPRQRRTTIMVRGKPSIIEGIITPEFEQLSATLAAHLDVVATRIIGQALGDGEPDAIEG